MNSKLKTLILCFWIVSTNELHITNRTLKNDKLVTLDILGRDSFVVDLEPDHDLYDHNNVEEDIELEPRECPPCLCLLEHDERDRENYIVADEIDLPKPVTPVSSSTTTSTLTTVKLTTSTTTTRTTTTTTVTTTTSTTTSTTTTTKSVAEESTRGSTKGKRYFTECKHKSFILSWAYSYKALYRNSKQLIEYRVI